MKHKIINVTKDCETADSVLLDIVRDDDGVDMLAISAWHTSDTGELYQLELIKAESMELLETIVESYNYEAAVKFANSFTG